MRLIHLWCVVASGFGLAVAGAPAARAQTMSEVFANLGGVECDDSELLCMTMEVPLDHYAPQADKGLEITYALSEATEDSLGVLVFVVGGPGVSGLFNAEWYLEDIDPAVVEAYDIVFFDRRGIGPVHGIDCPAALSAFYSAHVPLGDRATLAEVADGYIAACNEEMADPGILPFVRTDQAVRDLEMFRQAIGVSTIWLYGESYGTEFLQEYATTFPTSVAGIILDGVVDSNMTLANFYRSYLQGSEAILDRVLASCDADAACSSDMGMPAAEAYQALYDQLAQGPIMVDYPLIEGGTAPRELTSGLLDLDTFANLYSPGGRSWFLRVLAWASRGDLVPLVRDAYYEASIEPDTNEPYGDESYYGGTYYAVSCADWEDTAGDPDTDLDTIIAEAQAMAPRLPRLLRQFYVERSVCARMPLATREPQPAFVGGDYPTLILNASTDPITAVEQAYAVFDRSQNAAMVVLQGGPHVIMRPEYPCANTAIANLLLEGTLPEAPVQLCEGDFVNPYVPLSLPTKPLEPYWLARALLVEMEADLSFLGYSMDYDAIAVCNRGGTFEVEETDEGATLALDDCRYWDGIGISGDGTMSGEDDVETLILNLTVTEDDVEVGTISYHRDLSAESDWITGTWNGAPVATPRPGG